MLAQGVACRMCTCMNTNNDRLSTHRLVSRGIEWEDLTTLNILTLRSSVQLADILLILVLIRSCFSTHRILVISSNATDLLPRQLPPLSIIALPAQSGILLLRTV